MQAIRKIPNNDPFVNHKEEQIPNNDPFVNHKEEQTIYPFVNHEDG